MKTILLVAVILGTLLTVNPIAAQDAAEIAELKKFAEAQLQQAFNQSPELMALDDNAAEKIRQRIELELKTIDVLAEPLMANPEYRTWYKGSLRREMKSLKPEVYLEGDLDSHKDGERAKLELAATCRESLLKANRTIDGMENLYLELVSYSHEVETMIRRNMAGSQSFWIATQPFPGVEVADYGIPGFVKEYSDKLCELSGESEATPEQRQECISAAYVVYLDIKLSRTRASVLDSFHRRLLDIRIGPAYALYKETMTYEAPALVESHIQHKYSLHGGKVTESIFFESDFAGAFETYLGFNNFPTGRLTSNSRGESFVHITGLEHLAENNFRASSDSGLSVSLK